jgi:hypothetical protein
MRKDADETPPNNNNYKKKRRIFSPNEPEFQPKGVVAHTAMLNSVHHGFSNRKNRLLLFRFISELYKTVLGKIIHPKLFIYFPVNCRK